MSDEHIDDTDICETCNTRHAGECWLYWKTVAMAETIATDGYRQRAERTDRKIKRVIETMQPYYLKKVYTQSGDPVQMVSILVRDLESLTRERDEAREEAKRAAEAAGDSEWQHDATYDEMQRRIEELERMRDEAVERLLEPDNRFERLSDYFLKRRDGARNRDAALVWESAASWVRSAAQGKLPGEPS